MVNIILCGGSGTRLWPLSRTNFPKQYYKFIDDESFFQKTVKRNLTITEKLVLVSNDAHKFILKNQLSEIGFDDKSAEFFLEPSPRNTAPAIALACKGLNSNDIVLVTPSDHLIQNNEKYYEVIKTAKLLAEDNNLVTLGIKPVKPETGYGYIKFSGNNVLEFKEKPDNATAIKYLSSGEYLWNAGIFIFKVSTFFSELKKYSPNVFDAVEREYNHIETYNDDYLCRTIHSDAMKRIPKVSIDYAVMELSKKVKVVEADIGWSDVGSFDSLHAVLAKDDKDNVVNSNNQMLDSSSNLVISSKKFVSLIGINNCVIVDTDDALLIADKACSQDVKNVVEALEGNELLDTHLTVDRPWGSYTLLESSDRYKIKRIVVNPKKRLSLQSHKKRSEHWTVVEGEAVVTIGDKTTIVKENQSTYIPVGEKHRLENNCNYNLVLIEVQLGSYLEEDDIIRYDDDFKR